VAIVAPKNKKLTEKQQMALDLMTSGLGMKYKDIAEAVGVNLRTLYAWRNEPEYLHFQEALEQRNNERWAAIADAARAAALRLVMADNQKMTEFVLKNEGYNPTNKVEADITTDIIINIGGEEEENE
jgi:uncharacterized protein YjcR